MPNLDIFTETTQQSILEELRLQNALVSIIANGYDIDDWAAVAAIAQSGNASRIFSIGDQLISPWTDGGTTYQVPWDVKHFGNVVDANGVTHPAIFLQWHWATPFGVQFSHQQNEVATEATFSAGYTYYTGNSTDGFVRQTVTVGDTIPTDTTYYHCAIDDSTGNICRYGYNRWSHSAIRQWLNSNAAINAWWTAQHLGDVAPDQLATKAGFMNGLAADFLAVVKPIKITTALNTVTDSGIGTTEDTFDRFFLPSVEQMYGVRQLAGEGDFWQYWKDATELTAPSNDANAGRITYGIEAQTSAQYCRLRSAYRGYSYYTCYASTSGYLYYKYAYYAFRCAPACAIY